jgi:hypothetical protein
LRFRASYASGGSRFNARDSSDVRIGLAYPGYGRISSREQLEMECACFAIVIDEFLCARQLGEWRRSAVLRKDHDTVVDVQPVEASLPGRNELLRPRVVVRIQIIDTILDPLDEGLAIRPLVSVGRPVRGVAVFDDIGSGFGQQRKQRLDRRDLLEHRVTTIVDDDVERTVLFGHA